MATPFTKFGPFLRHLADLVVRYLREPVSNAYFFAPSFPHSITFLSAISIILKEFALGKQPKVVHIQGIGPRRRLFLTMGMFLQRSTYSSNIWRIVSSSVVMMCLSAQAMMDRL